MANKKVTEFDPKSLGKLEMQYCMKVVATGVIPVSRDIEAFLGGIVASQEGSSARIAAGDFLSQSIKPRKGNYIDISIAGKTPALQRGFYPISPGVIGGYRYIHEIELGLGLGLGLVPIQWYLPTSVRKCAQITIPFSTPNGKYGKARDYLLWDDTILASNPRQGMWVVPERDFDSLYTRVVLPEMYTPLKLPNGTVEDLSSIMVKELEITHERHQEMPRGQIFNAEIWRPYATPRIKRTAIELFDVPKSRLKEPFVFWTNESRESVTNPKEFALKNKIAFSPTLRRCWAISRETLAKRYVKLGSTVDGGEWWLSLEMRWAVKAPAAHVCVTATGPQYGLEGSFVVYAGEDCWSVTAEEMEVYTPVELSAIRL